MTERIAYILHEEDIPRYRKGVQGPSALVGPRRPHSHDVATPARPKHLPASYMDPLGSWVYLPRIERSSKLMLTHQRNPKALKGPCSEGYVLGPHNFGAHYVYATLALGAFGPKGQGAHVEGHLSRAQLLSSISLEHLVLRRTFCARAVDWQDCQDSTGRSIQR